jgi:hypothetical protein
LLLLKYFKLQSPLHISALLPHTMAQQVKEKEKEKAEAATVN